MPPYDQAHPSPLFQHHTTSLVFNDPPLHTRVRKLMMGALTRRAIADLEPGLIALVDNLLDAIGARGDGDLIEDFALGHSGRSHRQPAGRTTCGPRARCGAGRWPFWAHWSHGSVQGQLALGNRSVSDFTTYLTGLVAERRKHPGDPEHDVLTRLIQGEEPGERLSEAELLQNCVFILNAGHETTTNLIGNALVCLQEWPLQKADLLSKAELLAHIPTRARGRFDHYN